jgi:hypothetical protein
MKNTSSERENFACFNSFLLRKPGEQRLAAVADFFYPL